MNLVLFGNELEPSIRSEVLRVVPFDRDDRTLADQLAAMPTRELLVRFINWRDRLIQPVVRRVHWSQELAHNPIATAFLSVLSSIDEKIRRGDDVNPHLSNRVEEGLSVAQMPGKLNRRGDLDLLLSEWGIHHLHLSLEPWQPGFLGRTRELLFAAFTVSDCYFIDILNHGDWTKKHLVEVIFANWPRAGLLLELKGVVGLAAQTSDRDRAKLRASGVSAMIEVGGHFFVARTGGLSTAGTSARASLSSGRLLKALQRLCDVSAADSHHIAKLFDASAPALPSTPSFRFQILDPWTVGVIESETKHFIRFST